MRAILRKLRPSTHRSILGMDIGADGVRLALVRGSQDRLSVEWTEEVPLTELQGFADYDSVYAKLKTVIASRVRGRVRVATVPPWSSARVAIEEMPVMDAARFAKAATWYFARNRHEDMLSPVEHGIAQAERTTLEGAQVLDGMMVSMDQVMLDGLAELCRKLQLQLTWLVPAPLCYSALVGARKRPESSLVLDIGAAQTRMSLAVDGNVRLVRKLKPSANEIVRAVCEQLSIGWEAASQVLLAHSGIGELAHSDHEGIVARAAGVIERELDRLGQQLQGEIERSAAYVEARHGIAVSEVLIAGGLGGAPYLVQRLTSGSELKIAALDAFELIGNDSSLPKPSRPRFALAIGAAVLALQGSTAANMLGADRGTTTEGRSGGRGPVWTPRRIAAGASVIGLVAGVGSFDAVTTSHIARSKLEIEELHGARNALRVEAHELTRNADVFDLQDRIESLRAIYRSRHLYTPFFSRLVDCVPAAVVLDAIVVQSETEQRPVTDTIVSEDGGSPAVEQIEFIAVNLRGRARRAADVGHFTVSLEQAGVLSSIAVLRVSESTGRDGVEWYAFELQGRPSVERSNEYASGGSSATGSETGR